MIILTVSLDEHLSRSALLHARLCPRQVLGVRMARFACQWHSIDPAVERHRLFVFMEIGRCAADAVMMVTGANPMNQRMQLMGYGKVAATFVDLQTGCALRIGELSKSRDTAIQTYPDRPAWVAQRDAYQHLPDDQLFQWQPVHLNISFPQFSAKHAVTCTRCGDRVHDHHEIILNGVVMCKACTGDAYFTPADSATFVIPDD